MPKETLANFYNMKGQASVVYIKSKVITTEMLPVIGTFRSIGATRKMTDFVLITQSIVYGIIMAIAVLIIPRFVTRDLAIAVNVVCMVLSGTAVSFLTPELTKVFAQFFKKNIFIYIR